MSLFKTHNTKIYPWIKVTFEDDDSTEVLELTGDEAPVCQSWLGDLSIFYVADLGDRFQMILQKDLPENTSLDEVHELAVDNLTRDVEFSLHETNFGGYGLIAGGNHEAGVICLPDVWEWLAGHLDDHLIVGIPSKDIVMMVPESDTEKIADLKAFVEDMFEDGERLLTRNIFRYDKDSQDWTIVDTVN